MSILIEIFRLSSPVTWRKQTSIMYSLWGRNGACGTNISMECANYVFKIHVWYTHTRGGDTHTVKTLNRTSYRRFRTYWTQRTNNTFVLAWRWLNKQPKHVVTPWIWLINKYWLPTAPLHDRKQRLISSSCPSVWKHTSGRLPLQEFNRNLILGTSGTSRR